MRSTRSRVLLAAAAAVALLGLGLLVGLWFAPGHSTGRLFAGAYTSDTDLRVSNLTIGGGHVKVRYAFDVLFEPKGPDADTGVLRCGLVDTSGRLDFFESSRRNALTGEWTHVEYEANYDLPELTLGIRCSPSIDGVMSIAFRNIILTVTQLD
ncbi:MAG: hypothetical protein JWR04_2963 [Rhodoglobus sp.]|nr:hypothetical protein [Rhodoglobus sp.]